MIEVSIQNLVFGGIGLFGTVFTIYSYFKNPQIKTDQTTITLSSDVTELKKQITEIRETHLRNVEKDMKDLTAAVNDLSKTVVRLSTIIDERIPKGSPGLTPPGV